MPEVSKKLENLVQQINKLAIITEKQLIAFNKSQFLWQQFAEAQAKFIASEFEGGSMYSVIYSNCLNNLINDRINDLTKIIADMHNRYN